MARDLAITCCTSATLDISKLERRVEQEGVSFMTITLPSFGKDFERCLDQGFVDSSSFPGFSYGKGGLPLFLGGFLSHVFDARSGTLIQAKSAEEQTLLIDSIFAIRQLCYLFKKIELPCSDARTTRAMKGYLDCETELKEKRDTISTEDLESFRRIASLVFRGAFTHMDNLIYARQLRGRHGPGKTADRLSGNAKYDQSVWPERLDSVFPAREWLKPSGTSFPVREGSDQISNWWYYDQLDRVEFLEPEAEVAVKVTPVPKTLKTPRIIAIEPTCMQYAQQALLEPLVEVLERQWSVLEDKPNLTRHFVGFSDQNPNRDLARQGSTDGDLATLDLSEASDRVLNELVLALLHDHPLFSEAVQASRSTRARVLVGKTVTTVELAKFASMGSALCFPMEAMVFLTIVLLSVEKSARVQLTNRHLKSLVGSVRIYGDDIIVPVDYVPAVIDSLEAFGLKVNVNKSFWTGKFRESCGGDYFDGHDVTPVKFTKQYPTSRRQATEVTALVEFRNHVYNRGMWETARYLDGEIRGLLRNNFPIVESTSPALGRSSIPFRSSGEGWCPDSHVPLVRGYVGHSTLPDSHVSGEGALLKFFLKRGDEPIFDEKHLERGGRAESSSIQLGWVAPY
jgi:hypothetical protein